MLTCSATTLQELNDQLSMHQQRASEPATTAGASPLGMRKPREQAGAEAEAGSVGQSGLASAGDDAPSMEEVFASIKRDRDRSQSRSQNSLDGGSRGAHTLHPARARVRVLWRGERRAWAKRTIDRMHLPTPAISRKALQYCCSPNPAVAVLRATSCVSVYRAWVECGRLTVYLYCACACIAATKYQSGEIASGGLYNTQLPPTAAASSLRLLPSPRYTAGGTPPLAAETAAAAGTAGGLKRAPSARQQQLEEMLRRLREVRGLYALARGSIHPLADRFSHSRIDSLQVLPTLQLGIAHTDAGHAAAAVPSPAEVIRLAKREASDRLQSPHTSAGTGAVVVTPDQHAILMRTQEALLEEQVRASLGS
jgi:hypothetical protein